MGAGLAVGMMAETSGGGLEGTGVEAWTGIAEAMMAGLPLTQAGLGGFWRTKASNLGDQGEVGGRKAARVLQRAQVIVAIAWLGIDQQGNLIEGGTGGFLVAQFCEAHSEGQQRACRSFGFFWIRLW